MSLTLQELEQRPWPEPDFDDHTGQRLFALWQTPLDRLTAEDLRLLIQQQQALPHLVPLALDVLRRNLFAEGDYYPGDLLQTVLKVRETFWYAHRPLWQELHALIRDRDWELEERGIDANDFLELS